MRVAWLLLAACWHEAPPPTAPATVQSHVVIHSGTATTSRPRVTSPYAEVAGTWAGIGYQYDTRGSWDLEMTLFARGEIDEVIGTIAYESGNCTAELIRQPERGDTLVMKEKLVTGQGKCVDNGTIRIPRRPIAGELDWRWDFAAGNEGASSVIKRK